MNPFLRTFAVQLIAYVSALTAVSPAGAAPTEEPEFQSASQVNEGSLSFLDEPPAKPVHHHQNRIRIDNASMSTGWVSLAQCHDNLDQVLRAQITFREGFVRDLKIVSSSQIERAWVEDASVQLRNVGPGARLCLEAQTRALKNVGNGYFNLANGPFMRKFLDGYYPMRVSMDIDYPAVLLKLVDISPMQQTGFDIRLEPGHIRLEALFEGELRTLLQFERQ
jgi:hypothetical protein